MSDLQDRLDITARAVEPILRAILVEIEKDNDDN